MTRSHPDAPLVLPVEAGVPEPLSVASSEEPTGGSRHRLVEVGVVVIVLVAAFVVGYLTLGRPTDRPAAAPQAVVAPVIGPSAAPPRPSSATAVADVDTAGAVVLTQRLRWVDRLPRSIDVGQPDLTGVTGVPSDVTALLGRPAASMDGRELVVSASSAGWRVALPARPSGVVELRYTVTGALHSDPKAPEGRALAVIPLPPVELADGLTRRLELPTATVLNVSCPPARRGGAVVLCGRERGTSWVVDVPRGSSVVLAQVDVSATPSG